MSNGYILLWRKSLDSTVWTDAKLWRLWSWCLLRAAWKERDALLGRVPVRLRPGELAATLLDMAQGTGLSQKEVRTCLALGKRLGCLAVRGTARGMLVGIVNWQDYQRPGAGQTPPPDWMRGTPPGGQTDGQTGGQRAGRGVAPGHGAGTPSYEEKKGNQGNQANTGGAGAGALPDPNCERFLAAYPKRTARQAARAAWAALGAELPPLSELLAAVERQARSPGWAREDGRYIPAPASWLLGRRWQDGCAARPGVDQWLREASRPAAVRPDTCRPDAAARPDARRPDAGRTDAARPDACHPDVARPDACHPDVARAKAGPGGPSGPANSGGGRP